MSLQDELHFYDQVKTHYTKHVHDDLVEVARELERQLEKFLKDKSDLKNIGSVTSSLRFRIHSRAKDPDSLREKLVRSNEGQRLLQSKENPAGLTQQLCLLPDIVGVKVITDLSVDAKRVMDHIRRSPHLGLNEGTIKWNDLDSQPQQMRNGKKIYRAKGLYKSKKFTVGFELQVKGKLADTWSELEHPWFYKNSRYSPTRAVLHDGMEFVESLLSQVDKHLEELRDHTEKDISQYGRLPFYIGLSRTYEGRLTELFGHPFSLIELQQPLESCAEWLSEHRDIFDAVSTMSSAETLSLELNEDEVASDFGKALERNYQLRTVWSILRDWRDRFTTPDLELDLGTWLLAGLGIQTRDVSESRVDQTTATKAYARIVSSKRATNLLPVIFNPSKLALTCRLMEFLSPRLVVMGLEGPVIALAVSTLLVTTSTHKAPECIHSLGFDRESLTDVQVALQNLVQADIWDEDPSEDSGKLPNWLRNKIKNTCDGILDAK